MKVHELMVRKVATCGPETTFAEAAWTMRETDCGALPVVADGKVVGIITDRDLSMRLAAQSRAAREIRVGEALNGRLLTVRPEDDCATALELMAENQIRRLPVVDSEGKLQGVLSLNDFILHVDKVRGVTEDDLSYLEVMGALKAVSRHRLVPRAEEEQESPTKSRRRAREARVARR
jgi:CBS domain-containing protein